MAEALVINNDLSLPGSDLEWSAVRSSGPGGQNVNKVASKVELRFDLPATTALEPAVKERLRILAAGRLDALGRVVLVSQRTRDQARNLEDARERLRALGLAALEVPKKRRPTRPSRAARARRVADKRQHSALKRGRRGGGDMD